MGTDYRLKTDVKDLIAASRPWERVAVYEMGPLPMYDGKQYIVTLLTASHGTSSPSSRATTPQPPSPAYCSSTSSRCSAFLVSFCQTDRGPEFTSQLWELLGKIFGHKLIHTSPYYAQGNAICEHIHRTINNAILASLACNSSGDWPSVLPVIQLTINAAVSDATGYPPYFSLDFTLDCRQKPLLHPLYPMFPSALLNTWRNCNVRYALPRPW